MRDLNTNNGTFINRNRIGQNERPLEHGDQIKVGGSEVTLVFQQDAPGTVVVEAANTPPLWRLHLGAPVGEPVPRMEAASELQEAESALMAALVTFK